MNDNQKLDIIISLLKDLTRDVRAKKRDYLISVKPQNYELLEIDLSTAKDDMLYEVYGDFVLAETDGTLSGTKIRFNDKKNPQVDLGKFNPIWTGFYRFYLTHSAQSGKTLRLFIGKDAQAEASPQVLGNVNILDVGKTIINPRKEDGHGSAVGTPSYVDVTDRDTRLLGGVKVKDATGTVIDPAKEGTLSTLSGKLDNVEASLLGADETAAQSVTLDLAGRSVLGISAWASAATNFKLEVSHDNVNWRTLQSWSAVTSVITNIQIGFRYAKLSSAAAGVAGDTVNLVLQASR